MLNFNLFYEGSEISNLSTDWRAPQLVILNQPQETFRFRYETETTGRHGCLNGENQERSPITVQVRKSYEYFLYLTHRHDFCLLF